MPGDRGSRGPAPRAGAPVEARPGEAAPTPTKHHGFKLAQPGRSYRGTGGRKGTGGCWYECEDRPTLEAQVEALRGLSRTRDDYALLKAEMRRFERAATEGVLYFGPDKDVWRSGGQDMVLELRFKQRLEYPDGERRVIREYFSEPAGCPDALVKARIVGKLDSEDGLVEQDGHMAEAQDRILKFLGYAPM